MTVEIVHDNVRAMIARPADPSESSVLTRLWYDGWQDGHAAVVPAALTRARTNCRPSSAIRRRHSGRSDS